MDVNQAFPSNFLKAADLQNREIPVTIDRVDMETIGQDHKPVLYFQGKQKGIVLNKTNAMNIAAAYGSDTDGWTGEQVVLFSVWTDFQGKSVQAIRVRPGQATPPKQQQRKPAPQANGGQNNTDLDDDIPF